MSPTTSDELPAGRATVGSLQVKGTRGAWVSWFAGFFLLAAGWALVTPINGFPDEVDHVYRAVSVVRGEIFPHIGAYLHGTGSIVDVPVELRNAGLRAPCSGGRPAQDSVCAPERPGLGRSMTVETSEGRRFPLYYAVVGWPSLVFPNQTGWILMRLVSAALCSAFLASAAYVLMSMRRRPLVLGAGLFVGLTPLAINIAGALNPSGLEISSALCVWAVVLAMVYGTSSLSSRRLAWLGASSCVAVVTSREPGFVWIVLAIALAFVAASREQRVQFVRAHATRVMLAYGAAATFVMAVWSVEFHSYDTFHTPPASGIGLGKAVTASFDHAGRLLQQTLAYLGYLTVPPPVLSEVGWALAVLALVGLAFMSGRRVGLAALVGCAIVVLMPFAIEVATYSGRGLAGWQGRYTLPFAVGVPVLAVAPTRPKLQEWKFAVPIAVGLGLLTIAGQYAVFKDAWHTLLHPHWYVRVGDVLFASGAAVVIATVAWTEARWRRAPEVGP